MSTYMPLNSAPFAGGKVGWRAVRKQAGEEQRTPWLERDRHTPTFDLQATEGKQAVLFIRGLCVCVCVCVYVSWL